MKKTLEKFGHFFFIVWIFFLWHKQSWSCLDYVLVSALLATTPVITKRNLFFLSRPPSPTTGAGGVALGARAGEATPGVRFSGGIAGGSCAESLQCTCKAWMQLQMPLKAFACVSKRESLTRDLNGCLIWEEKKKTSTQHFLSLCLLPGIFSVIPIFSPVFLIPQSKNKYWAFK